METALFHFYFKIGTFLCLEDTKSFINFIFFFLFPWIFENVIIKQNFK